MTGAPPLFRVAEFSDLDAEELDALKMSCSSPREIARGTVIRRQGEPVDQIYVLKAGWVLSGLDLPDGHNQVVKVHLPGDILGAPSMVLTTAAETLWSVTPATISSIPLRSLARIFHTHPKIGLSLFLCAQQERIFLMDRLTSVGRIPALKRVAAFLLHIHDRLQNCGECKDGLIRWPLTQQHVGDILGLTSVHVNRMLQALIAEGLIARNRQAIHIPDVDAMRDFVPLPTRQWVHDPDWLRD
ncbi:Crp/Fnr family transcriptional regulator [Sphingobium phenoxybenzoativorans]|uniref:Crp/Fnr family transcriptional regulator n=1 Tax=Sphingobium phenoxybenzoativorans TaxID=1592790 RepID=UPI0009F72F5F|nr:Crp/Fnr family transcriptional regulator [Sphingobium phenoxybenzoativorans]